MQTSVGGLMKPQSVAPVKSTYVPQHLQAVVGGGGHGSVAQPPKVALPPQVSGAMRRAPTVFSPSSAVNQSTYAPTGVAGVSPGTMNLLTAPAQQNVQNILTAKTSGDQLNAAAARQALQNAGVSYYPSVGQTAAEAALQHGQPTTPGASQATQNNPPASTAAVAPPGVTTPGGGPGNINTGYLNYLGLPTAGPVAAAPGAGSGGTNPGGGGTSPGTGGGGGTNPATTNPAAAVGSAINGVITAGQGDQGNVGTLAQGLGGVGTGLPGSISNAQAAAAAAGTQATGTNALDQILAGNLANPSYLQQLAQNQLNQYGAQQMQQMQNAYQTQLGQLASQGIAQGGAAPAAYQGLLSQVLGNQGQAQAQLANDLLQNYAGNAQAAGNLSGQGLNALNLPFGQQMQLAGLQDTAANQSANLYSQLAGQNYGLAGQLESPLMSYYSAQAMAPYMSQLMGSIPALLAQYMGTGVSPTSLGY